MGFLTPQILNMQYFLHKDADVFCERVVMDYEFDLYLDGRREMEMEGERWIIEKDALVFRKPGQMVRSKGDYNCYIMSLDFSDSLIPPAYDRNSAVLKQQTCPSEILSLIPPVSKPSHSKELAELMMRLADEYAANGNSALTRSMILQFLFLAVSDLHQVERENQPKTSAIQAVSRYIRTHYQQEINLNTLAQVAHLNRSYLVRKFEKEMGLSPIAFLIKTRLDHASLLLQRTDRPIGEIAAACGYESAAFFSSSFRQKFGCSPSAYRQKYLRASESQ